MTVSTKVLIASTGLFAVLLFASTQVMSQEKKSAQPPDQKEPGQKDMEEMMAQWAAMNAKGPEHEKFESMVGTWDAESRFWMSPDAPPTVSKGSAVFKLIFDGRYIEQRFKCDWQGKPFEGIGIEGYDNFKKKYVSIWFDDQSTGIYMSLGTSDETGKVCTYYGKMDDPMTGQKDKVVKSIAREISKDKAVFEMYDKKPDGEEFKSMEITYTRRK
ncbi:MAG: DUF1579 domain-containing protein [Planctomycetota bacterium]